MFLATKSDRKFKFESRVSGSQEKKPHCTILNSGFDIKMTENSLNMHLPNILPLPVF